MGGSTATRPDLIGGQKATRFKYAEGDVLASANLGRIAQAWPVEFAFGKREAHENNDVSTVGRSM